MPEENKEVYYRTLAFHSEPLEFYDNEAQANYEAEQYGKQQVRKCTTAQALNILLEQIRFLKEHID